MSLNDSLAAALSAIDNAERQSKKEITLKSSTMLKRVLELLNAARYVGSYEEQVQATGTVLVVQLLGSINRCGVIKPRSSFQYAESEAVEKKYLPAKGFGVLIVSTSQGVMTLVESRDKKIGGRLIAYCY